ncbi:Copper transporter [Phaffia rhodozyma]|uniref:Copper transport protein n=1 Tax=Phaffia rhodozyma TaxID=264483 RepID=A0A0F7STU3_PHARH|nr:Copper transporter [Phaffia rhodozyma]
MDHGDHSGHNMPSMAQKCTMHMLFNWQVEDTCVVFRSWHISNWLGMVMSCLAIILIALGYEWTKHKLALYDRRVAASLFPARTSPSRTSSGMSSPTQDSPTYPIGYVVGIPPTARLVRATGYALSVFISFFLMLVFMTYNGYLILATVVGAGVGHYVYNQDMEPLSVLNPALSSSSLACH